jgi:hypothetical protein
MAKQTFTSGNVLTAAQMTSLQQTAMGGGSATAKTASYVLTAADAGTTVIMNSASSTTITVNTALFSAGDTVNIQNIGAGVCTITAGTATVNTAGSLALVQYEGGILYFVSASSATYFDYYQASSTPLTTKGDLFGYDTANARIPIGTNNQVLTADSAQALGLKWAAVPAAAKSYSLLGTGTLSSGSTVTVSGISGINTLYIIVARASTNDTGADFSFRINADSGSNYARYGAEQLWTSTYNYTYMNTIQGTAQNQVYFTPMPGAAAGAVSAGIVVDGCNSSGIKTWTLFSGADLGGGTGTKTQQQIGIYSGTSTVSSFSILCSSGAFDSGSFLVYGSA